MTQTIQDNTASTEAEHTDVGGRATKSAITTKTDHRRADPRMAGKVANPAKSPVSKSNIVLKKLRTKNGATLDALIEITGWQAHSVRGFLSGTVKKKLGFPLTSDIGKDGKRRYRLADPETGAE